MRPIDQILIHCTETPDGEELTIGQLDARHGDRGMFREPSVRWRCNPGLAHIAVHHLIYVNGAIASGRHHDEPGPRTRGASPDRIDVALVGSAAFTAAQWRSLRDLVEALNHRFPGASIVGHRELAGVSGACPGFSVAQWLSGGLNPLPEHLISTPAPRYAHFARAQGVRL